MKMPEYKFMVTVECDTKEEADQVMGERLGCDEDYGFEYSVDWEGQDPRCKCCGEEFAAADAVGELFCSKVCEKRHWRM
jgi:hypothetical protein